MGGTLGRIGKFIVGGALIVGGIIIGAGNPLVGGLLVYAGAGLIKSAIGTSVADTNRKYRTNQAGDQDPIPIVYGERLLAPVLNDWRVSGDGNKYLYLDYTICHAPDDGSGIEGLREVKLDGKLAFDATGGPDGGSTHSTDVRSPFDGKLRWALHYGRAGQEVNPELHAKFPNRWPTSARGAGLAHLVLRLEADDELWRGVPNVTCVVRGLKVEDPRTGVVEFSTNPAACQRDLLRSRVYGVGVPTWEIENTDEWSAAADHCDETITVEAGEDGPQQLKRYECNLLMDAASNLSQRVAAINSATHGKTIYAAGEWYMAIRQAAEPVPFVLIDEDMIVGTTEWQMAGIAGQEGANSVNASYTEPDNNWSTNVFVWPLPGQPNPYLAEDGDDPAELSLQLPAETNYLRAGVIARMVLLELREGDTMSVAVREEGLELTAGMLVNVHPAVLGEDAPVPCWVEAVAPMQSGLVQLELFRYNPDAYVLADMGDMPYFPPAEPFDETDVPDLEDFQVSVAGSCATVGPEIVVTASWGAAPTPWLDYYLLRWTEASGDWTYLEIETDNELTTQMARFRFVPEGRTYTFEATVVSVHGYTALGGTVAKAKAATSWDHSVTIDLATQITRPDLSGLSQSDVSDVVLAGQFTATVDVSGTNATRFNVYAGGPEPFTVGEGKLVDVVEAADGEVAVAFVPPVNAGEAFFWQLCGKDCFSDVFGESASCSPLLSSATGLYPGFSVVADPAQTSCDNLAGLTAADEHCLSGAGEIRGHEYDRIMLDDNCIAAGALVSASAEGKVGTGGAFREINPAGDLALVSSGKICKLTFDDEADLDRLTIDEGAEHISVEGGALVFAPGAANKYGRIRFTDAPDGDVTLPTDEMQCQALTLMNESDDADSREDYAPVVVAIMGTGRPWEAGGQGISNNSFTYFGPRWTFGSYLNGVWTPYSTANSPRANEEWTEVGVRPDAVTAGKNFVRAGTGDWNATKDTADNYGVSGWPGMYFFQSKSGNDDPVHVKTWYGWTKSYITVKLGAGTYDVRVEMDDHGDRGPTSIQHNSKTGDYDLELYPPGFADGVGPYDRLIILDASTGEEVARIEPSEGVWGGSAFELNPSTVSDCKSTLRLEVYDGSGALLSSKQAVGVAGSSYERFVVEGLEIPAAAVPGGWILPVHYKLGADNCSGVCIRRMKTNLGGVATGYTAPGVTVGSSLDALSDSSSRVAVSPSERTQIGHPGTNIIPARANNPGEETLGASDTHSEQVEFQIADRDLEVADEISYSLKAKSATGADSIQAVIAFIDSAGTELSTAKGNAVASSVYAVSRVEAVAIPASTVSVRLYGENATPSESWNVKAKALNRGPVARTYELPPVRPFEADAGSSGIGLQVDLTVARMAKVAIDSDTVIALKGLANGEVYRLLIIQDGVGGHDVRLAGVEWESGEPNYDSNPNGKSLIEIHRIGGFSLAWLIGKAFALGTIDIRPPAGAVSWEGATPTVFGDVLPAAGEIIWDGAIPQVDAPLIQPPAGAVSWDGATPGIEIIAGVQPPAGAVSWDGATPTVEETLVVPAGAIEWRGAVPTLDP